LARSIFRRNLYESENEFVTIKMCLGEGQLRLYYRSHNTSLLQVELVDSQDLVLVKKSVFQRGLVDSERERTPAPYLPSQIIFYHVVSLPPVCTAVTSVTPSQTQTHPQCSVVTMGVKNTFQTLTLPNNFKCIAPGSKLADAVIMVIEEW